MRTRLRHLWEVLTSGYWFVPAVMSVSSAVVATLLLMVDRHIIRPSEQQWLYGWLYGGGSDGAKTLLSAVASSVITVAGVVFSITIAALTQASSQFGPRLLRNFMRDTSNQVVLGTFVATFLYCLLVLRTIHGDSDGGEAFVPQASVTVAVLLAVMSIAVLIYFIHHVSISLQAPAVIASVGADLDRVIDRLPEQHAGAADAVSGSLDEGSPGPPPGEARLVPAHCRGYLQAVDYDGLIAAASRANAVLRLTCRPSDFIIRHAPLVHVWPADLHDPPLDEAIREAFICGDHETPEQDIECAVRQLVELAVRALSPGINDPFTAVNCLDELGAGLCRIARKGLPGPLRYDDAGRLRLITPVSTFDGVVDAAFNQIRQYGASSVAVAVRMLEVIALCAGQMCSDAQRRALWRHAEMTYRHAARATTEPSDLADLRDRLHRAARACNTVAGSPAESQDPPALAHHQVD